MQNATAIFQISAFSKTFSAINLEAVTLCGTGLASCGRAFLIGCYDETCEDDRLAKITGI